MKICGAAKAMLFCFLVACTSANAGKIDFNRDIRSILSNRCLTCHGPDPAERKGGLRLDTQAGSRADLGGYAAVTPGDPDASALLERVITSDEDDRMPPSDIGPRLTPDEVALLKQWVSEGGEYAQHWAYVPPSRPALPPVKKTEWVRNPIDRFVLSRLENEGAEPSEEADRWALARRAAIDLTGLPPSFESVQAYLSDESDFAFERYVDGLLTEDSFGERWARVWLDLARYADSAGYADDPPRTIWGYRDYVIRALNDNMPFDQFTVEQLAGDLLPNPSENQLIATAFHRNTMTNSEGGTNDEQFRNEAIVDRVNTTMAVWMGTTIACAQCHNHKYDPITQEEYFKFFAFFNNTQDNDQRNEQPLFSLFSEAQKQKSAEWKEEITASKYQIERPNDVVAAEQGRWEARLKVSPEWQALHPMDASAGTRILNVDSEGVVRASGEKPDKDRYQIQIPVDDESITAIRLETLPQKENFAVSQVTLTWEPSVVKPVSAQYVRIELPGKGKILSLAEVEVISRGENLALKGAASQSSTASGGDAGRAIDGNTSGQYNQSNSTTHTATTSNPWWELDLGKSVAIDEIRVWNRTDGGDAIGQRIKGFQLKLLSEDRSLVDERIPEEIPVPNLVIAISGAKSLEIASVSADFEQRRFAVKSVLQKKLDPKKAWAVGGQAEKPHEITLVLKESLADASGKLVVTIGMESNRAKHLIDGVKISSTASPQIAEFAGTPKQIRDLISKDAKDRSAEQRSEMNTYFRTISPSLRPDRERLAMLEKNVSDQKPLTTVPIFRELAADKRRETHIQVRGNYLNKEGKVDEGTPASLHPLPSGAPKDRLTLARWLVSDENPLTARVIANRHWEQLFGMGIVSTSEEFGSQGELPSHPELLDWMAVELMDSGWDLKHLLKLVVSSATYRQSSRLTEKDLEFDPDNHLYGRGPRFRLSAEMIRDQALAIGGLLSDKKYGPPARPAQPKMGLSAAFGSGIDWETSKGADRYRRGLYTNWRRSNPYPSMTTFDAPTREVCTVRRPRSNTPLQALVTLNDPVYVEAAQGLARRIVAQRGTTEFQIEWAFRTALVRAPSDPERDRLVSLYQATKTVFEGEPEQAKEMATIPLGDPGDGTDYVQLAAWTVVGNVILNLDEIFLKR
jgi:hypothetical protein